MSIVLLGSRRGNLCEWEVLVHLGTKMFTRFLHGVEGSVHELVFIKFSKTQCLYKHEYP